MEGAVENPRYFTGEPIAAGDWIRVYVPRFGVWHHGIVRRIFRVWEGFAIEVAHNKKTSGVSISDWYDFSAGNQVHLHRKPSRQYVPEILARVEGNVGKPYHVFAQNCEHFASYAFTGRAESKSVEIVGWSAVLALVLTFLNRR